MTKIAFVLISNFWIFYRFTSANSIALFFRGVDSILTPSSTHASLAKLAGPFLCVRFCVSLLASLNVFKSVMRTFGDDFVRVLCYINAPSHFLPHHRL